jgi:cold shock CspA family protein
MPAGRIYLLGHKCCWVKHLHEANSGPVLCLYSDATGRPGKFTIGELVEYQVAPDDKSRVSAMIVKRIDPDYGSRVKRVLGTVVRFDTQRGWGTIEDAEGKEIFVHFTEIHSQDKFKVLREDEEVEYELGTREDGSPQAIRVVQIDRRKPLERFARLVTLDQKLEALARLAEPEKWDYQYIENSKPRPILYNYIHYTFARLEEESKISFGTRNGEEFAGFNTGLVTVNQEEIFGLFVANRHFEAGGAEPKWLLKGFHKESDYALIGVFPRLPELASYFSEPAELLYDRRLELFMDIDHMLCRKERFPEPFRKDEYALRAALSAAKEFAKKRVYRNYKTAVRQFHRGRNRVVVAARTSKARHC